MQLTTGLDLLISLGVIIFYFFKINNLKKLFSKYRIILIFYAIVCFFIQWTKYNSGDLFYYSTYLKIGVVQSFYSFIYFLTKGYLSASVIAALILIELRLKMLDYLLRFCSKMENNIIFNKFTQRLYIYLFVFSPSLNIFLFYQGKDIAIAIFLTIISIILLEKKLGFIESNAKLKKNLIVYFSFLSIFEIRIYYIVSFALGYFLLAIKSLLESLKIKRLQITIKNILIFTLTTTGFLIIVIYIGGLRRIGFFLDFVFGSQELQQIYTEYLKSSIQLQPWDWPWKIFTIIRPLPFNTGGFNFLQKVIIYDHFLALGATLFLLSRFSKNKIYIVILSFIMMTVLTTFTTNINDMYRRFPVYLMLPVPVILNLNSERIKDT